MAIVTDPDSLDRQQVIFNIDQKLLYVKGVGTATDSGTNGSFDADNPGAGEHRFTASGENFDVSGAAVGDIVCIETMRNAGAGPAKNAGHWKIKSVDSATQLTLEEYDTGEEATPVDEITGDYVYSVRPPTGGTIEAGGAVLFIDTGVTLQCLYSFSKEEWKDDNYLNKIQFPFELITREQGEIGGGNENSDWDFGNDATRELIRTGGFDDKNTAGTSQRLYAGIVTLGSLDTDTQVYYQQVDEDEPPADFARTGAVNTPLLVYTNPTPDNRTYLKLFARKKARTYDSSEIADIDVTSIEGIVNRFPLAHIEDPAITAQDAQIDGAPDYFTSISIDTVTAADVTASTRTITKTGENFTTTVTVGDILYFTAGTNSGNYYEVETVTDDTNLVVTAASATEGSLSDATGTESFTVYTPWVRVTAGTGAIADVDGATGTLIDSTVANFNTTDSRGARAVAANDIVVITEAASNHRGAYKVVSQDSATQLTLNTSDRIFTSQSAYDYEIFVPSMHIEYKSETRSTVTHSTDNMTFNDDGGSGYSTMTRSSGSWITDGYEDGDLIVVAGTSSNNGTFSIQSVDNATVITLNSIHTLTDEGPTSSGTTNGTGHFARSGFAPDTADVFPFEWRMFGNDQSLAECFQFIQRQLRIDADIDRGPGTSNGKVTDPLMSFVDPNGVGLNMFIDDLLSTDINNSAFLTAWHSATGGSNITLPFTSGVTITVSQTLIDAAPNNRVTAYFDDPDGTPSSGDEYGTAGAIVVDDKDGVDIDYTNVTTDISTTFAYDTNAQGGRTPGTNADVTVVGIGTTDAQFALSTRTITRTNENPVTLTAALERNYSNP